MAEWIARGGAEPQPPRGPDTTLRELIDVLAIGQSERVGPATLTLLSVERYRDGFLAQFRLLQEYTPPEDPTSRGFPELVCEASDERGSRYTVWPDGGSGGGGRGVLHWRLAYRYAPALDPAAHELRLSIPTVRWRQLGHRGSHPTRRGSRRAMDIPGCAPPTARLRSRLSTGQWPRQGHAAGRWRGGCRLAVG